MGATSEVRFLPAGSVTVAARAAIMNAAYADYYVPMRLSAGQLAAFERAYDIDLTRSLVALVNQELVAIASVAVRGRQAWIGGVGVLPPWRRRGIAREMMVRLIADLAELDVRRAVLEVIDQNTAAIRLYESLGFQVDRELLTWHRPSGSDPLPIPGYQLTPVVPRDLLAHHEGWHDQPPCWQAARATLDRLAGSIKGYLLSPESGPAAYGLVNDLDETVWLLDVGVAPEGDGATSARLLLQALAATYLVRPLTMVNLPADSSLSRVFAALRFLVVTRQLEMTRDLGGT